MKKKIIIAICIILALGMAAAAIWYFGFELPEQQRREEHARLVQMYRDNKMAIFNEENQLYEDGEVDVAFIGDSLTDMYDVKRFYPQYLVSNRGIGGDTSFDLEGRLQASLYDLQPKVVVMLIGGNNPYTMLENYEQIVISMKEHLPHSEIVLISMTSMGGEHWGRHNQQAAFNNVRIKMIAQKHDCIYVDMFSPLLNPETNEIYEEYTIDGGHLTEIGYEVFTKTVTPAIEAALEKRENNL